MFWIVKIFLWWKLNILNIELWKERGKHPTQHLNSENSFWKTLWGLSGHMSYCIKFHLQYDFWIWKALHFYPTNLAFHCPMPSLLWNGGGKWDVLSGYHNMMKYFNNLKGQVYTVPAIIKSFQNRVVCFWAPSWPATWEQPETPIWNSEWRMQLTIWWNRAIWAYS